ncbi:MAG: hypothetical protein ABWX60_05265 [Aeromicrobium sp.]
MSHRILVVCTANVCRSPVIEAMLRGRLDDSRYAVGSAGVRAPVDRSIDPDSAQQLRVRGVEVPEHAARQLTRELVARADLVLTATRAHRSEVLDLDPRALRRTFTALEFAGLAEGIEADGFVALVAAAAAARSTGPSDVDLVDPIGRSTQVHAEVAARIDAAVTSIVTALHRVGS